MAIELQRSSHIHINRRQNGTALPTRVAQPSGVSLRTRAAQALMLFVGIVATFGVAYFTVVAPESGMTATDGLVAALLFIGSVGYIAAGRKLSLNDSEIWMAALGFATLRVVMSLVKVFGYEESDATLFLVLDVVIFGLLLSTKPENIAQARTNAYTSK